MESVIYEILLFSYIFCKTLPLQRLVFSALLLRRIRQTIVKEVIDVLKEPEDFWMQDLAAVKSQITASGTADIKLFDVK